MCWIWRRLTGPVEIRWCPAHEAIAGSEKEADEWAKIAAYLALLPVDKTGRDASPLSPRHTPSGQMAEEEAKWRFLWRNRWKRKRSWWSKRKNGGGGGFFCGPVSN